MFRLSSIRIVAIYTCWETKIVKALGSSNEKCSDWAAVQFYRVVRIFAIESSGASANSSGARRHLR
jgi:hypothetical protein